uniref:Uncharacterized protein n=1 Tax=Grammatophora oceanica TaxID=210454 RepID=A0A7S1Y3I0_9STRA|mmetsp:Transcript_24596/g.36099  ORF Transcript_24596/g.36099 Transcript_24596/m.36099 type:complete len:156 (+) Transcript_24596:109-576(+)
MEACRLLEPFWDLQHGHVVLIASHIYTSSNGFEEESWTWSPSTIPSLLLHFHYQHTRASREKRALGFTMEESSTWSGTPTLSERAAKPPLALSCLFNGEGFFPLDVLLPSATFQTPRNDGRSTQRVDILMLLWMRVDGPSAVPVSSLDGYFISVS